MFLMTFILAVLLFWEIRSLHRQGENRTMAAYILISLGGFHFLIQQEMQSPAECPRLDCADPCRVS